jgi:hypothetical protein
LKKRGESELWLDYYAKYQFIEYYRKRVEELELVQKTLLQVLVEEKEKEKEQQDKTLINQLSKTIAENTKTLGSFGLAPPILSKMQSALSCNYKDSQRNKVDDEEIERIKNLTQNVEGAFYLKMDNEDDRKNESLEYEDAQRVF